MISSPGTGPDTSTSNNRNGASTTQTEPQLPCGALESFGSQQSSILNQHRPNTNGPPSVLVQREPVCTKTAPPISDSTNGTAKAHEVIEILGTIPCSQNVEICFLIGIIDDSDTDNDLQLALRKKTLAKDKAKEHQGCLSRTDTSSIGPSKFTVDAVGQLIGSRIEQGETRKAPSGSRATTHPLDEFPSSEALSRFINPSGHPPPNTQVSGKEATGLNRGQKRTIDLTSKEDLIERPPKKTRASDGITPLPRRDLKEKPSIVSGGAVLQALQALRDANHQSRLTTATLSKVKGPSSNRPSANGVKTESQGKALPKRPSASKSHGKPAALPKDVQASPLRNHLQVSPGRLQKGSIPSRTDQHPQDAEAPVSASKPSKLTAAFLERGLTPHPPPPKSLDQASQLFRSFEAKRPERPKTILQANLPEPGVIEAASRKSQTRTEAARQRGRDRQAERKKKEYLTKLKTVYPDRAYAEIDKHADKLVSEWDRRVREKKRPTATEPEAHRPAVPVQKFVKPSTAAKLPVSSDQPVVLYTVYVSPRHKEGEAWQARTIRGESFLDKAPANKRAMDLAEQCRSGRSREPRADVESMSQDYGGGRDGMFYGTIRFRDGSRIYVFVDKTNQLFGKLDQALIHGKDLKDGFLEQYEMRWDVMVFKERRGMTCEATAAREASSDEGDDSDSQEEEAVVEDDDDRFLDISHAGAYTNAYDANVQAVEAFKAVLKLPPRLDSAGFMFYRDEILPLAKQLLESDFRFKKDGVEISYGPLPEVCGYGFNYVYVVVNKIELKGPIELGRGLVDEAPDKVTASEEPSASGDAQVPADQAPPPTAQGQEAAEENDTQTVAAAESSESSESEEE